MGADTVVSTRGGRAGARSTRRPARAPAWSALQDGLPSWTRFVPVVLIIVLLLDHLEVTPLPGPVGLAVCAMVIGIGVYRQRTGVSPVILPSAAVAALFAVLTLSVFWSDVPDYTGERLRTYAPTLLAAWYGGSTLRRHEVRLVFQWVTRITLSLYVVMIALFPWARDPEPGGPEGWHANISKNGLGLMLALLLVLVLAFEVGRLRLLEVLAILVLSAGNQSRTSQISMALVFMALAAWVWLEHSRGPHARRRRLLALGAAATLAAILAVYGRELLFAAVGKDSTLTSRTIIWEAAADQIAKAPLLGHGAFAFLEPAAHSPSQQAVARYFHAFVPPHAHNGVLDLVGQIGVLGLVAYAATWFSTARAIRTSRDRHLARFGVFMVLLYVMAAPVEPLFLGAWLVLLMFVDGCARRLAPQNRTSIVVPTSSRKAY